MAEISSELNNALRREKAWEDVAGGLGKVLLGYVAFVAGLAVAIGFFSAAIIPLMNNKQPKIEHIWYFYIGAATMKVSGLASWGLVLAGQWRCLMSSSERSGARWIMFFCMTCVVMGPVLHYLAWLGGLSTPIKWTGGPQAFHDAKVKFTMLGLTLMCASLVTGLLYKLSFWYYLQTVARCMEAPKARAFVILFMAAVAGAVAFTAWWLLGNLHPNMFRKLAIWVGASWLAVTVYWVAMIVVVKIAIQQTVALVYNPMAPVRAKPQYQMAGS